MASRVTEGRPPLLPTVVVGVLMVGIFALLVSKHYEVEPQTLTRMVRDGQNALTILGNRVGVLNTCGEGEAFMAFSPTVYVCNNAERALVYDDIYTTYPASGGGREAAYTFLNVGERERADEMLADEYFIERYEPVTLDSPLSWTEDPFGERYWRFIFYSLRPTRHLLAAANETQNEAYYEKLREIIGSFLETGVHQEHAWDDGHGVAFRTMVLVNTWWKLREAGELPNDLSDDILASLEAHGDFLMAPENYEEDNNHAVTQATALLVLAHSFPDLANAPVWRQTAIERIDTGLREIIDEDGVLIENSPYYHFYVLEKYWEIRKYADGQGIEISDTFTETVDRMIDFATYVLTPAQQPPLLGASIPREISRSGEFREIADDFPFFNYVMTDGNEGRVPEDQYRLYPSSGIALLRSGWGDERAYEDELHILFDTGPYRTDHSDLDTLTFSAYAAGAQIVRDTGLFTYEVEDPYYEYFHGTNGHNTVMVDGQNQSVGSGTRTDITSGNGYAFIAAQHTLYPGVTHNRALAHIEDGAVIIIDSLASNTEHEYEQLFHLSEDAALTDETSTLVAGYVDDGGRIPFSIEQFGPETTATVWEGDTDQVRGLCATAYETSVSCPEVSFAQNGTTATYITVLRMGNNGEAYTATYEDDTLSITTADRSYRVRIDIPENADAYIDLAVDVGTRADGDQSFIDRVQLFFGNLF